MRQGGEEEERAVLGGLGAVLGGLGAVLGGLASVWGSFFWDSGEVWGCSGVFLPNKKHHRAAKRC